jgi:hypothetical protein
MNTTIQLYISRTNKVVVVVVVVVALVEPILNSLIMTSNGRG